MTTIGSVLVSLPFLFGAIRAQDADGSVQRPLTWDAIAADPAPVGWEPVFEWRKRRERTGGSASGRKFERAVVDGCTWLVHDQGDDGCWRATAPPFDDAGVTGIVLSAILGGGYEPGRGEHAEALRAGIVWLCGRQQLDGGFGDPQQRRAEALNHAFATLALLEAFAESGLPQLHTHATRAVRRLTQLRSSTDARSVEFVTGSVDHGVTVAWASLAEATARHCDVSMARPEWLGESRENDPDLVAAAAAEFFHHILLPGGATRDVSRTSRLPDFRGRPLDAMQGHWATLALYQLGKRRWMDWSRRPLYAILAQQRDDGGWEPACRWTRSGGEAAATALAVLTLETVWRYRRTCLSRRRVESSGVSRRRTVEWTH